MMSKFSDEQELLAESLCLVAEKPEEAKITVFRGSGDTNIITVENLTEEDEGERKARVEKAINDFKQGFKGELTGELIEKITEQVTNQMILEQEKTTKKLEEDRIRFEEEKEQLRQDEFKAQIKEIEIAQREEELNKGKLEVVESTPSQQGPTKRKKISIFKRFMLIFENVWYHITTIILYVIAIIFCLFLGYLLSFLVFPENEVPKLFQPLIEYLRPIIKGFVDFILDIIGK